MATSGVLKITTRLTKDKFKKDLKGLTKDIQVAEAETNAMGDGAYAMSEGLGASVGAMAKIAVVAALVVGAFVLIKKAVENIVQNNEEVAGKIEAIRNALSSIGQALVNVVSNIILPIVEKIVNFIYLILSYVNEITKAWWGYDMFAENASENLASGASSAKAIEKALGKFDTAHILGNEKDSAVSGTAVKNAKKFKGELSKIPGWLQKIIDSKPIFDNLFTGAWKGVQGIWTYLTKYSPLIGLITGGTGEWYRRVLLISDKWDEIKQTLKETSPLLYAMVEAVGSTTLLTGALGTGWDEVKNLISACVSYAYDLWNWIKKALDKLDEVKKGLTDSTIGKLGFTSISSATKSSNALVGGAASVGINSSNLVDKLLTGSWNGVKKLFGLASGGIVNNPGPGVPLSNIVVGEKGPEAVLPLTDGTLQKLANMIPVQIELTNTIDGRVLSRRLETIRQNSAFSRNGV